MLSSPVFRYAKPEIEDIKVLMLSATTTFTDTQFAARHPITPMNRGLFDVITQDGRTLNRAEGFQLDYWFEGDVLVTLNPGTYTLRVYDRLEDFEDAVIPVGRPVRAALGGEFVAGVPFWPQILSQPERGIARVSNDGQNVAFLSQGFVGQSAFAFRLVNAYGQVSEPACVRVTTI